MYHWCIVLVFFMYYGYTFSIYYWCITNAVALHYWCIVDVLLIHLLIIIDTFLTHTILLYHWHDSCITDAFVIVLGACIDHHWYILLMYYWNISTVLIMHSRCIIDALFLYSSCTMDIHYWCILHILLMYY